MEQTYTHTLESALQARRDGRIEQWIHDFLLSEGVNTPLSDGLKLDTRQYLGPLELPMNLLTRCTGPEPGMKHHDPEESFNRRIAAIGTALDQGFSPPPLFVNYSGGELTINDGNHRYAAYEKAGWTKVAVIIWTTGQSDKEDFERRFPFPTLPL